MLVLRIVGVACYLLLGILILTFIFSNRGTVSVDLFPFGSSADLPLYVMLSLLFASGLVLGLLHSMAVWLGMRRKLKRAERAITQLEKEISLTPAKVVTA